MNVFSSMRSRVALAVLVAATTLLGLASAGSPASANWDGIIGTPGQYLINPLPNSGDPTMIEALMYANKQTFVTAGVNVTVARASKNPQTVVARYRLEYKVPNTITWAPIEEYRVSQDLPGFSLGTYPLVDLGGHWFSAPKVQPKGTLYRIMYTVEWWDKVTGKEIGYRDVYPETNNNACTSSVTTCTVSAAGITW